MNLRQAAQLALEALEDIFGKNKIDVGAINALRAALAEPELVAEANLKEQGWRQCAKGQRTTQFCGMVEQAVKAEREACAKVCEEDGLLWGQRYAAAIRSRSRT